MVLMFLLKRLYGCTVDGLGKFFILALFQVGGLGIMTHTIAFALLLGVSLGVLEEALGKIGLLVVTVIAALLLAKILGTAPFNVIFFEKLSAMGTVGLSLGLPPHLSSIGKCIIILSMRVGKIGLLAFLLALG
jgi:trk system potassium uptake protein TrkH